MAKTVPINVNKGNMSNTERKAREKAEARLRTGTTKVKPPRWLSKEAKKEFRRLAKMLIELDLIDNLDVDLLAVLANTIVAYQEVSATLAQDGRIIEYTNKAGATNIVSHPAVAQQKQLADQIRMLANEFGLTPSARAKLALPRGDTPEPTAFDEMFGDVLPFRRDAR